MNQELTKGSSLIPEMVLKELKFTYFLLYVKTVLLNITVQENVLRCEPESAEYLKHQQLTLMFSTGLTLASTTITTLQRFHK